MDSETVISLGKDAIMVTLTLAAPLMAVGLLVGLIIGIFQTVTSVQESTLAYIPKMVAVFVAFLVCLPWMIQVIVGYTAALFGNLQAFAK
ncbi:MAG TPA: flagellar biosynthesis protein FliQ [Planctomycetota bacterium]|nr:flagellar biosynthesis protein FliQ [Planctomycetota bacterium]